MTVQYQRFCPLCDRAFEEGEAVLRCEGCGVMHHPACWVRNDGCTTRTDHKKAPIAQAYSTIRGDTSAPGAAREVRRALESSRYSPSPNERLAAQRAAQRYEPPRPVLRQQPAEPMIGDDFDEGIVHDDEFDDDDDAPVIGAIPGARPRQQREVRDEGFVRPTPPRRYVRTDGPPVRKPLPRVYGRHRVLDYWYVPVAAVLAIAVAFAVIWVADRLLGDGDGDNTPAAVSTVPTTSGTQAAGSQSTPGAANTPNSSTPATTGGTFQVGDIVLVTGSGECLNVRPAPGLDADNAPIACLPDGSEFRIKGGPQSVGNLQWWNVETEQGDGWAAEDYLQRKP
ncbi:MAG: RING finger protein [Hyphomicrobiales bacterium]